MASANEDARKILIAFDKDLLSNEELRFLEEVLRNNSHQSRFPFRRHKQFDWEQYDDRTCMQGRNKIRESNIPGPLRRKGFAMAVHKSSSFTAVKILEYNT